MTENSQIGEKKYVWDDAAEALTVTGVTKEEDEEIKSGRRKSSIAHKSKMYSPHGYLVLSFRETLSLSQKINFRKRYVRKVPPSEIDVVILQDVKDLILYLVTTPIALQFINFFHLPLVDRFLRALVLYFQYYIEVFEEIAEMRTATVRRAPNPLAGGSRLRRADEMKILRCVLGREYSELIVGSDETAPYHHMNAGKKSDTQSQGEKDLRIFETLIAMAHRVVWITFQRKYYSLIEVEMHRLFRTDAYNIADRRSDGMINRDMLENEIRILQGPKMPLRRKLLRNSPLPYQIVNDECDYRVLSLGMLPIRSKDPRINYLENALLGPEETFHENGIRIGILGQPRSEYDIMFMPADSEDSTEETEDDKEKDKRKSTLVEKIIKSLHPDKTGTKMPLYGPDQELLEVFPVHGANMRFRSHEKDRENSRKKWIARELRRQNDRFAETSSIATTLDN